MLKIIICESDDFEKMYKLIKQKLKILNMKIYYLN